LQVHWSCWFFRLRYWALALFSPVFIFGIVSLATYLKENPIEISFQQPPDSTISWTNTPTLKPPLTPSSVPSSTQYVQPKLSPTPTLTPIPTQVEVIGVIDGGDFPRVNIRNSPNGTAIKSFDSGTEVHILSEPKLGSDSNYWVQVEVVGTVFLGWIRDDLLIYTERALDIPSSSTHQSFTWRVETIDSNGQVGGLSSLAIDKDDNVHVIYFDDQYDRLRYTNGSQSSWKRATNIDGKWMGLFASMALDLNDNPHVVHYDRSENIRYGYWTGSRWSFIRIRGARVAAKISLAIDGDGNSHILYFDENSSDLYYLKPTNNGWDRIFVADARKTGFAFPIVVSGDGQVHICFYSHTDGLVYARYIFGSWEFQVVDTERSSGLYSSLAIDRAGNPHISYYDQSKQILKYAHFLNAQWQYQIVDNDGSVGKFSSLAIDNSGSIHIAYFDETNIALKYAFNEGSGWEIYRVDNKGDVGGGLSLALDSKGFPHISYFDGSNENLKYAYAIKYIEGNRPDSSQHLASVTMTQAQTLPLTETSSDPTTVPLPSNYTCLDLNKVQLRIGSVGKIVWKEVNLRSSPAVPANWDSNVLFNLDEGEEIIIIGGPECAHSGTWWEVLTESGYTGWMRELLPDKKLIEPEEN